MEKRRDLKITHIKKLNTLAKSRKPGVRCSNKVRQAAVEAISSGIPLEQISAKLKVSKRSIMRWLTDKEKETNSGSVQLLEIDQSNNIHSKEGFIEIKFGDLSIAMFLPTKGGSE